MKTRWEPSDPVGRAGLGNWLPHACQVLYNRHPGHGFGWQEYL